MAGAGVQHTHYNQVLTNISVEFHSPEHVAEQVMPRVRVEHETDVYYQFDKSSFNITDDERADGTPENEATGGWVEKQYALNAYGLRDRISKRMRTNSDSALQLDISVTNRLTAQIKNNLEYRVLGAGGLLRSTGNNIGSATPDLTVSNASPRTVVMTAISTVQQASGMAPNVMVMNPQILREVTLTAEYRDEFKYVTDIRNSDIPTQLYGLKIIQAAALGNLNSSGVPVQKGIAPNLQFIMNNDIWIGYVKPGSLGMRDMTYGVTFFSEQYTRKWFEEDIESDWIAVNDIYIPKLIAKEAGYIIQTPFG